MGGGFPARERQLYGPESLTHAPRPLSNAGYATPTESIGHPPFGAPREVFGVAVERWRPPALDGSDPRR